MDPLRQPAGGASTRTVATLWKCGRPGSIRTRFDLRRSLSLWGCGFLRVQRGRSSLRLADLFAEHHAVLVIDLVEPDLDHFVFRGLHDAAHVIGLDRELAPAAVDEHAEFDAAGAAVVDQRVERG